MKKVFLASFLVIITLAFFGCQAEYPKQVKFEITSNPSGMSFSGVYGNSTSTVSVDGTTPATYTIELKNQYDVATGVFQKMALGDWTMTVTVYVDGKQVDQKSTSAEYGIVTISATGE